MMTPREKMQSLGHAHANAGVEMNEDIARTKARALKIGMGEALQIYRQAYRSKACDIDKMAANRNAKARAFLRSQSQGSQPRRTGPRGTFVNRPLGAAVY